MQRPTASLRLALRVQCVRDGLRLRVDFDHRPKRRSIAVDRFDALQIEIHQPTRRIPAVRHRVLELRDGHFVEFKRGDRRTLEGGCCRREGMDNGDG